MQWESAASLFSALSYVENTGSFSLNPTITNWFLIETRQSLPPVVERVTPAWLDQAKCRGLPGNLFYADHQHNGQVSEAKSVCLGTHPDHPGRCPVLDQCLDYALNNSEKWGVWGGCSERERRKLKRQKHREAALSAGNIITLDPSPGDRQGPAGAAGHQQEGDPAPWGHSKGLIEQRRRLRQTAGRPAPLGDGALGLVS